MANGIENEVQSFSTMIGFFYVFNLIVGTGALALPSVFQSAGYLLSSALLFVSAFVSYVCATFLIECLGIANAALKARVMQDQSRRYSLTDSEQSFVYDFVDRETTSFEITKKVEVSEMAHIFLGKIGVFFTYLTLTVYLFGDLSIYTSAVSKSLMNVFCSSMRNASLFDKNSPCLHSGQFGDLLTRFFVYRLCVLLFVAFCLPMVLIGMTKTKYLQLATTASRWTAFILMILLASIQLIQNGKQASPPAVNFSGFESLFGVAVYAFMCHHSIPGLITPIQDKSFISFRLIYVYLIIFTFYCTLSITGAFTFKHVSDVYTLNFFHDDQNSFFYMIIDYFLALFPVFTLTSNAIIVAITLSNNCRVLIAMVKTSSTSNINSALTTISAEDEALLNNDLLNEQLESEIQPNSAHINIPPSNQFPISLSKILNIFCLPALVLILPSSISFFTDNVLLLTAITGSYPGVGVQFIIPSILTIGARAYLKRNLNDEEVPAVYASPFCHWIWPYLCTIWGIFAVGIVSTNLYHLS